MRNLRHENVTYVNACSNESVLLTAPTLLLENVHVSVSHGALSLRLRSPGRQRRSIHRIESSGSRGLPASI